MKKAPGNRGLFFIAFRLYLLFFMYLMRLMLVPGK